MFKKLLLLNIFIYVSIHLKYANCAPRFKRISNDEINNETSAKNLGDYKTTIEKIINNSEIKPKSLNTNPSSSQGKIDEENLNTTPKKNIKVTNDKNVISTCENFKPDIEVLLVDNIPKLQEINPLYKLVNGYEPNLYEQNNNFFPKWLMRQQNKPGNRRTVEMPNMILGLDEQMSMDDYGSEYIPLKKKFNSMIRELDMSPYVANKYCPIHISNKHNEKSKDMEKSSKEFIKICTCRIFEKPIK